MEDLAAAAGLSKSSIYHHVQGKEQLLGLALDRALDGLFAVLGEPGATTGPAVDRLTHVIRRHRRGCCSPSCPTSRCCCGCAATAPPSWPRWPGGASSTSWWPNCVLLAQRRATWTRGWRPRVATRLIFGMINSLTEWYRPGRVDRLDLPETVVRWCCTGLALRTHRRRGARWDREPGSPAGWRLARDWTGLFPPLSSSGLGRRPFTAVARVRIPLGVRGSAGSTSTGEGSICSRRLVGRPPRCRPGGHRGPVAQLVSAPPCHGGGRGFESRRGRR